MTEILIAVERSKDVRDARKQWQKLFQLGATVIGSMSGQPILWHENRRIWGMFGATLGRAGIARDWNPYGQKPYGFRSNIIVEINPPPSGIDPNLQGIFAVDKKGVRWVLHQGRMSVPGRRVTEDDFIQATGLRPVDVRFSDGLREKYHKIAPIDAPAPVLQAGIAAFVAECSKARLAKTVAPSTLAGVTRALDWEHQLRPEVVGNFEISARESIKGHHKHGQVWRALSAELARRRVAHSNDRVGQYGPDIFTYEGKRVLFEIKSNACSHDVFEGVGQLQIYEKLLGDRFLASNYFKALVLPRGMRVTMEKPLNLIGIALVSYERRGRVIVFDKKALDKVLT